LAKSAVEDMFRMSENLAAQFSGGHAPLDLRDRDVVPSIREAIDAFRLSYEPFGVEVGYRGPDSVIARVDDVALRVVLRNLLDNAVRAIQRLDEVSSRRIEVRVIPTAQARVQRIEVEDSGPGVPPELGDSIYQVGVSSSSSSGIGLPACRFFASMMGAFLDHVQGTALGGANFRVKFEGQSE
jgi:signal transduction histidine kinase